MGKKDEEDEKSKKKGSSFLGRWFKRFLVLGVIGAGALGYAFYSKALGPDGQPQHKLPWQDTEGFQKYTVDTFTWARSEGTKVAEQAKAKVDAIDWSQWSKEAESLYDKAAKVIAGNDQPAAPAPAVAAAPVNPAKPGDPGAASNLAAPAKPVVPAAPPRNPGDPVAGPGGPAKPGYYDAYKAGFISYRDGCTHFRNAKPGVSKNRTAELKAALKSFDDASAQWQKAQELRDNDPHLDELLNELMQYRKETRTQLERAKAL